MEENTKHWFNVSIVITSETLTTGEITRILNSEPDRAYERGTRMSVRNPKSQIRTKCVWVKEAPKDDLESFNDSTDFIYSLIRSRVAEFRQLAPLCQAALWFGYSPTKPQFSFNIHSETIKLLSDCSITITMDIYEP